jgi:hypothetical protein
VPEERPVPVSVFLGRGENDLARGDIVLSRSRTLVSSLVRFVTGSEFSHAALVFLVPKYEEGFSSTFVLESTRRGVSLARLEDYVDRKTGHSDVVILRLVGEGFDEAYFKRVRGLMLNHINAEYDYWRSLQLAVSLLFGIRLGWHMLRREHGDAMRETIRRTRHNRKLKGVPPEFICSGFIQYGLVQAAKHADQKRAALLKGGINYHDDDALLGVTPEDIARSTKLTWCWAIARGRARRVGSYGEALAFMNGGK